jgi:hypothetical protein
MLLIGAVTRLHSQATLLYSCTSIRCRCCCKRGTGSAAQSAAATRMRTLRRRHPAHTRAFLRATTPKAVQSRLAALMPLLRSWTLRRLTRHSSAHALLLQLAPMLTRMYVCGRLNLGRTARTLTPRSNLGTVHNRVFAILSLRKAGSLRFQELTARHPESAGKHNWKSQV